MNIYKVTKYKVSHHNYVPRDLHVILEMPIQKNKIKLNRVSKPQPSAL